MNLRTIIIFALLVCACILPLHAQVGEQRHNFAVGVNGGINLNSVSFSPSVKQKNLMGINGGVTARYISEKYFSMICGAQTELNFSQHGWDEYYEDYPTLSYTRTIHAGPQIGFLLGDSEKIDGDWDGTVAESYTNITVEQHGKAIDNKFDYGIAGGAGIELRTKAGNFIVEGRYYYALSDFYGSTKKDFFSRSAHGVITAKITYLFDLKK